MDRPLIPYDPNPILGWLYERFFEHIEVDERWAQAVREADARGTVVYILRNLSFVDFLALDYLAKRLKLPEVRFANDLGLWVLEPMGRGWLEALKPRSAANDAEDLGRAVKAGTSAVLFLKRPPTLLESGGARPKIEGDVYLKTLLEVQRHSDRPILLVPQVFIWSKRPDAAEHGALDAVLGPREWPGKIRTVAQFLANYRNVTLRAGEPVDLKSFLAQSREAPDGKPLQDDVLVRRLTYTLLRRLERERHAVLGPTKKPADRLREEVIRSPKLQKVIGDMAGEGQAERRVMTFRAMAMLREMEADLDAGTITAIDAVVDRVFSRMYSALEVDEEGIARLRRAMKDGSVILLPSHKSHIDYIVLAFVLNQRHLSLPVIAAGDNLNFFPLGPILRRAGAFYIRRSFKGDRLYGAVVDAYMRRLVIDGWSLEFFLEGGRSRTGKLLSPKLGLLSLVVDAALGVRRPMHFAPVSIGYERVVEEKAYVHELSGGEKSKEDVRGLLSSAEVLGGRYGRISVQFGELLTLEQVLADIDPDAAPDSLHAVSPARRRALTTRLAHRVMHEMNRVTAVTPGAVVATALLTHEHRGISHEDLVARCRRIIDVLHAFGARFSPSLAHAESSARAAASGGVAPRFRDDAIREACELFVRAGHVEVRRPGMLRAGKRSARAAELVATARVDADVAYVVHDAARLSLDLAKNGVVHFFVDRALVATAALVDALDATPGATELGTLSERVLFLSRLFKYEFIFRTDATFERIFEETVAAMVHEGELVREGSGAVRVGEGEPRERLVLYAQILKSFVEGYRVAARTLAVLPTKPFAPKDLAKRAIATGERMFLAGEIERPEAVSRPLFDNAMSSFVDQGYLARVEGKLELAESYQSPEAARTIEGRIARLLVPKSVGGTPSPR